MSSTAVKWPWSRVLSTLGFSPSAFEPRMGGWVTPRLRLLYPLKDGYRLDDVTQAAGCTTWVADHLGLATRVEVAFGTPSTDSAGAEAGLAFPLRARLTAQINEPHVVRILEQGSVEGVPFIVTELLEGRSFRHRLMHGPASLADVATLVVQACEALGKAHALGISHGGLRPDCLYSIDVADQPFVKIAGFGATSEASNQSDYASPERLLGARDDARSDLWALAVSVYELLTTTLPFEAATPAGITVAICNGQFTAPNLYRADLPRGVDGWFARALAKEPAQRFLAAAEFARSFVLALSSEPAGAEPLSPDPEAPEAVLPHVPEAYGSLDLETSSTAVQLGSATALPAALAAPPEASPDFVAAVSPAVAVSPPPLPIGAALDDSLEMDDGEEDEKTVKWDSPSEWPNADERAPAAILPSVVPHPLSGAPKSVGAATPGVASARQGALTQRIPRAALGLSAQASAPLQPAGVPPTLEPAMYMDSPYIASVASALAVSNVPPAPDVQRGASWFTSDKTWLAAAAFVAGVMVTWFTYDPEPRGEAVEALARDSEGIRTISVDDLPRVSATDGHDDEENLPAIIETSQLPRVVDEVSEPRGPAPSAPGIDRRTTPIQQKVQALTPAPGRAAVPARAVAATRSAPVARAAAPSAAAGRGKPVDAHANCSPPYSFDKQGIQRLKPECLGSPTVIAGPYGAVMTTSVSARTTAPATGKPLAAGEKEARAGSACTPPYFFDGKIRRVKANCL